MAMKSNSTADVAASDALTAQAIDLVLQTERDARAAVAACERTGAKLLDVARHQAREICDRAQARTVALHGRAAKTLELRADAVMQQRMQAAAETVKKLGDPGLLSDAIERLTARLTIEAAPPDAA